MYARVIGLKVRSKTAES